MITIIDYRDKTNLLKFSNLQWIYIGSYKGSEYVKNILQESNRIFIGKDIENIMNSVQQNFIDYIGKVSLQQNNKVLWYSIRMASKSIQTSMFHQYVYLKVLERFMDSKKEDILVVSGDDEFFYNVNKILSSKIRVLKERRQGLNRPYKRLSGYVKIARYCVFWFLSRFFKSKKLDAFNVFLHSWIDERVFQKLPDYNDSYFRDLENVLKKHGHRVGRLAPLRVSFKNILKLNKYFDNMVYPFAYVSLGCFLKSIFTKFAVTISHEITEIEDMKILEVLLENEIYKENSSKIFLEYLLFFCGYKAISRRIRDNSSLIYPFENQPWERMFNAAFADFNKVAYQHSTIPYNYLDYRVSLYEDRAFLPKTILTTGKKWTSFLEKYYHNSTIKEAGAMRYSYLFKGQSMPRPNNQVKNIVVILDMVSTIAISLQKQLLDFLKRDSLREYNIKIKPHAFLPKYASFERFFVGYNNCQFVKSDMSELLKDCFLLVASNSSVIFESVFSEIKTLSFIPEEPSLGMEHYLRDSLFIAYSENFADKFQEAIENSRYPKVNIEDYFSVPDYSVFLESITTKPLQDKTKEEIFEQIIMKNISRKSEYIDVPQIHKGIPLFSWIDINLTELCSRKCVFCPRNTPDIYPNQNLHMELGLATKIAEELKKCDYSGGITFSGFSESLLNPNIVEIVAVFGKSIHTELATNGDKLNDILLRKLFSAGLAFMIINMYDGHQQVEHFEDMFKRAGLDESRYLLRNRWYGVDKNYGVDLTNRAGTVKNGRQEKIELDKPCFYTHYAVQIDWNGDVLLCPHDFNKKIRFGNLYSNLLWDVWISQNIRQYRKILSEHRDIYPCNRCNTKGILHGSNHVKLWK